MSGRIMAPDHTRPTGSSEAKIPEGELLSACIAARARPSTTRTPGPALTPSRILARARTLAFSDRPTSSAALALPTHHRVRPSRRPQWARPEPQTPRNASTRARCAARANPPRGRARPPWRNSPTPKSDKKTSSDPWCARARPPRARAPRPPRPPRRIPPRPPRPSPTQPPSPVSAPLSPPPETHASYDPKTRVVKQLQSTVDNLLREQASHARLESTSRETFAHLAAEIERVRSAVATLADAVIEEMDAVRADHAAWRSEKRRGRVAWNASRRRWRPSQR